MSMLYSGRKEEFDFFSKFYLLLYVENRKKVVCVCDGRVYLVGLLEIVDFQWSHTTFSTWLTNSIDFLKKEGIKNKNGNISE